MNCTKEQLKELIRALSNRHVHRFNVDEVNKRNFLAGVNWALNQLEALGNLKYKDEVEELK